jgi:hypothetical protein
MPNNLVDSENQPGRDERINQDREVRKHRLPVNRGVDVATYFVTPLMNDANGWIWLLGQNCAHSV